MYKRLSNSEINAILLPRGITMTGDYVNIRTKTEFTCDKGHSWLATPHHVKNSNSNCPKCSSRAALTLSEVKSKLINRGVEIVGDYINGGTKTEFSCSFGHRWYALPNNVLNMGTNCPECSTNGYNPSKPGTFYVIDFGEFIKYGITNNIDSRLKSHKKNGVYRVVITHLFEDGKTAVNLERHIKCSLGGKFVTKEQCPDGYTETLCPSNLNNILSIINEWK